MIRYHYRSYLAFRVIGLILFALLSGFLLAIRWYYVAIVAFIPVIYIGYRLFLFAGKSIKETYKLIDTIRFSEFNISFQSSESQGLPQELVSEMNQAIHLFNQKIVQAETRQLFYESLLNRIDFGVMVIADNGDITWINKTALDELRKPQPRNIRDLGAITEEFPDILHSLRPKETKIIRIKEGSKMRQLSLSAIFFSSGGNNLKLVSIKNIQSVLDESESEAWKKLIRVLTHEIMNSLTPIISLSESLSDETDENKALMTDAMNVIHRRSKGLVQFVQNYQKMARIPMPVLTLGSVGNIVKGIAALLQAENIYFQCSIQPENMQWNVDQGQIEQVLINLIKNAHEACVDIPNPDIQVNIHPDEYQRPVIIVTDNGCGILPEVQDKIFVPFFTTKQGGSGIGLSICRQIIVAHKGSIMIESEFNQGTCVKIRI